MLSSPHHGAIGFHAQQAVEKFLKAFLVRHEIEFPKTHDLEQLLDLTGRADAALSARLRPAAALNPYGVEYRYPSDSPDVTDAEARKAVDLSNEVREAIRSALDDYVDVSGGST